MKDLERLIRAMLVANAEALNLVQTISNEVYEEFNEERESYASGVDSQNSKNTVSVVDLDLDDLEAFEEFDDLKPWEIACCWGVPFYMWDVERTRSGVEDEAVLTDTLLKWTVNKMENPGLPTPFHYAICAHANLQGSILTATFGENDEDSVLRRIQTDRQLRLPGFKLLKRKGVRYLYIDWRKIGQEYVGIRDEAVLSKYVIEREGATKAGVCECVAAVSVSKNLKRGLLLDLSELL
jgi:hypothetical protein